MSTKAGGAAKAEGRQTRKAAVKPKVKETKMYVGPTISGVAIQNTVYTGIPAGVVAAKKENPSIMNLFIPVREYPEAERQLRRGEGCIFSAYKQALSCKVKKGAK